jgi:hypothetical protein
MPPGRIGALNEEQVTSVVAAILEANGVSSGLIPDRR